MAVDEDAGGVVGEIDLSYNVNKVTARNRSRRKLAHGLHDLGSIVEGTPGHLVVNDREGRPVGKTANLPEDLIAHMVAGANKHLESGVDRVDIAVSGLLDVEVNDALYPGKVVGSGDSRRGIHRSRIEDRIDHSVAGDGCHGGRTGIEPLRARISNRVGVKFQIEPGSRRSKRTTRLADLVVVQDL